MKTTEFICGVCDKDSFQLARVGYKDNKIVAKCCNCGTIFEINIEINAEFTWTLIKSEKMKS